MKPITQIEKELQKEHNLLFDLFTRTAQERSCILGALVNAYLKGRVEQQREELLDLSQIRSHK